MSFDLIYILGSIVSVIICLDLYIENPPSEAISGTDAAVIFLASAALSWVFVIYFLFTLIKGWLTDLWDYLFNRTWGFKITEGYTGYNIHEYKAKNFFDMAFHLMKIRIKIAIWKILK